jgi:hypothetical protein
MNPVHIDIRMPESEAAALRELYAVTYPEHRLSFNRWLVAILAAFMKEQTQ